LISDVVFIVLYQINISTKVSLGDGRIGRREDEHKRGGGKERHSWQ